VDEVRGLFLAQLQELSSRKARILQDNTLSAEARAHQVANLALPGGAALDELALTMQYLPSSRCFGFAAADLRPGGADQDVRLDNVDDYVDLTLEFCLETGLRRQMEAFRDGFNRVFSLDKLRAFSPDEVRLMVCGNQNPHWTRDDLINYTEPKLGYTRDRLVMFSFLWISNWSLCRATTKIFLFFLYRATKFIGLEFLESKLYASPLSPVSLRRATS
jgi:E3 ubiquitin-protein ligase HECTD1